MIQQKATLRKTGLQASPRGGEGMGDGMISGCGQRNLAKLEDNTCVIKKLQW